MADDIKTLQKQIKLHEEKLKTMFQAMQRMEKVLRVTEKKATRAVDESRRQNAEIAQLKALLKRGRE